MDSPETPEANANGLQTVVPGWYRDPSDANGLRWWDGSTWTQTTGESATGPIGANPPTHPLAVASLCCSIAGWFTGGLSAIVGVVLGYRARREIRASAGTQGGEGLAKAGIIVGWAMIGLYVVIITLLAIAGSMTN